MDEEYNRGEGWTYVADDGIYDVEKFTDVGQQSFDFLIQFEEKIRTLRKLVAKLEEGMKDCNRRILRQLTEEMRYEPSKTETDEEQVQ